MEPFRTRLATSIYPIDRPVFMLTTSELCVCVCEMCVLKIEFKCQMNDWMFV